jgi:hypothetical protein
VIEEETNWKGSILIPYFQATWSSHEGKDTDIPILPGKAAMNGFWLTLSHTPPKQGKSETPHLNGSPFWLLEPVLALSMKRWIESSREWI